QTGSQAESRSQSAESSDRAALSENPLPTTAVWLRLRCSVGQPFLAAAGFQPAKRAKGALHGDREMRDKFPFCPPVVRHFLESPLRRTKLGLGFRPFPESHNFFFIPDATPITLRR